MNHPPRPLLATLGINSSPEDGTRCYIAYPNLRQVRWVSPPSYRFRHAAANLYRPQTVRGKIYKHFVSLGFCGGERIWLKNTALSELETKLARALDVPEVTTAIHIGTSGAYQKGTLQVMTIKGQVIAYAKVADHSLAQAALENERQTLLTLSKSSELHGCIPTVLDFFFWRDKTVLLTSAGPNTSGPNKFSDAHLTFLKCLHRVSNKLHVFSDSPLWKHMVDKVNALSPYVPDPWRLRYRQGLEHLELILAGVYMPVSMAHRDFVPWNTCLTPSGLFVFDWESAVDGAPLLYDAFHFHMMQAALTKKKYTPDVKLLSECLSVLWQESKLDLLTLYLLYLMDISIYYGEARILAPDAGEEYVWNWYGSRLDECLRLNSKLRRNTV